MTDRLDFLLGRRGAHERLESRCYLGRWRQVGVRGQAAFNQDAGTGE